MQIQRLIFCLSVTLLTACATPASTTFPPPPAMRGNGYEGATRPQAEVATVFILDGRPKSESGYICAVNGKPVSKSGGCVSVLYLLPGTYSLSIRYQSSIEYGSTEFVLGVEAKKVYQLNATSFRTMNRGMVSLLTVQDGHRVTHRNVAPGIFASDVLDREIPYGPSN